MSGVRRMLSSTNACSPPGPASCGGATRLQLGVREICRATPTTPTVSSNESCHLAPPAPPAPLVTRHATTSRLPQPDHRRRQTQGVSAGATRFDFGWASRLRRSSGRGIRVKPALVARRSGPAATLGSPNATHGGLRPLRRRQPSRSSSLRSAGWRKSASAVRKAMVTAWSVSASHGWVRRELASSGGGVLSS